MSQTSRIPDAGIYRPYVPRLLQVWLAESPHTWAREIEGSMLFVDVSGFTALSERLAKRGRIGAEELTEALGGCFANVLQVAYAHGGSLIKFGGDALLLFFDDSGHELRACRAAIGMRRALRENGRLQTAAGRVTVRMSAGVHSGTFHFFLAGRSHRELVVAGPSVTTTVRTENDADAGEIVVSESTAAALPRSALGHRKGAGWHLARAPHGELLPYGDADDMTPRMLAECIPAPIRRCVESGVVDSEHRMVTVAFLHFEGTDRLIEREGVEVSAEAIAQLVADVQGAADAYEVTFLGSDIDKDGGKIILVAGAPTAMGDDEQRLLLAVRQVAEGDRRIPLRIGVNRGHVFAGHVGPHYRRTYTVMGDAVNLAARVMAKAKPGEVLATPAVTLHVPDAFELVAVEPFMVKGKSRPVEAFRIGDLRERGESRAAHERLPLVGREHEVERLDAAVDRLAAGSGGVVSLVGEAGIGKSRLLAEIRNRPGVGSTATVVVACESYSSSTPYRSVGFLLRGVLGIDARAPAGAQAARLARAVDRLDPEIAPLLPLVAEMLDLPMTETLETAALKPRFRKQRLEEVSAAILLAVARDHRTLVLVEDIHWMDDASADVLRGLAGRLGNVPLLFVLSRRDVDQGFVPAPEMLDDELRLTPLDETAAVAIANMETDHRPLPPQHVEELRRRAGGNPFFLRELLREARSSGGLDLLPDSLDRLLVMQIDRLDPADRRVLRYAAVLGAYVDEAMLEHALGEPPESDALDRLDSFLEGSSWGGLRFRHALIRDAAYEGLPYRLRRDAHARVGDAVRARSSDAADEAELLSLHYFYAERYADAWQFSRLAGDRAKDRWANADAAVFYRRALQGARKHRVIQPDELAAVHESLGDVRRWVGAYPEAAEAYSRARSLLRGQLEERARLLIKHVQIPYQLGRYSDALRLIARAERLLSEAGAELTHPVRVEALVERAAMMQAMSRTASAISSLQHAIDAARAGDCRESLARAYTMLDWAYTELGRFDQVNHYPHALAIYEELGDLKGQAMVHGHLGGLAYWQGRWDDAVASYTRSRDAELHVGDVAFAAVGTANIGEIRADQGRLEDAEPLLAEALRVLRGVGDRVVGAFAAGHLARVRSWQDRPEEALELAQAAFQDVSQIGIRVAATDALGKLIECLLRAGRPGDAELMLRVAEVEVRESEAAAAHGPTLERLRGYLHLQAGRSVEAGEAFGLSVQMARARDSDYGVALAALGWQSVSTPGSAPPHELTMEAAAIFRRLGVLRVFEPIPMGTTATELESGALAS